MEARRIASPMHNLGPATRPILVIHSDDDRSVPVQQAIDFVDALDEAGVQHGFVHYADRGHMRITDEVIEETLAFIAYRQPITRGEIEDIRGVSVSSEIIKTLREREWIKPLGHKEVPGRPMLYGTTREFLDYFNLKSLNELPTLAEIRDLDQFHPELMFESKDEAVTS